MKNLKLIFSALLLAYRAAPLYTVLQLFFAMITTIFPYLSLAATASLLNALSSPNNWGIHKITYSIVIVFATNLLMSFINNISPYIQYCRYEKTACEINKEIIQRATNVKVAAFDSPRYLNDLNAFISNSGVINTTLEDIVSFLNGAISLICLFVLFERGHLFQGVLIVLASVPSFCLEKHTTKRQNKEQIQNRKIDRQKNYFFNISSDKRYAYDIRLHSMSEYLTSKYEEAWRFCFLKLKRIRYQQSFGLAITRILPELLSAAFVLKIVYAVLLKETEIGSVILYTGMFESLIQTSLLIIRSISSLYEDALKLITFESIKSYPLENCNVEGSLKLEDFESIVFDHVFFRYAPNEPYIIKDLSFSIDKGDCVCLWGKNGSGKSTIFKLLLRYYDVTSGKIMINSIDIKMYSVESIRKAFNQAFQYNSLYAFSLKENFLTADFSRGIVSDEEIRNLFRLVSGNTILEKIHNGINGTIYKVFDPDGFEPSGGEYQKIALARTLYRKSFVLLLDEATAAFDNVSEERFFYNVKSMCAYKTVVFTSHNPQMVKYASKVVRLDNTSCMD